MFKGSLSLFYGVWLKRVLRSIRCSVWIGLKKWDSCNFRDVLDTYLDVLFFGTSTLSVYFRQLWVVHNEFIWTRYSGLQNFGNPLGGCVCECSIGKFGKWIFEVWVVVADGRGRRRFRDSLAVDSRWSWASLGVGGKGEYAYCPRLAKLWNYYVVSQEPKLEANRTWYQTSGNNWTCSSIALQVKMTALSALPSFMALSAPFRLNSPLYPLPQFTS